MLFFKRMTALVLVLLMLAPAALAGGQAVNILLIGVDSMNSNESGRSDTMLLVRADPADGSLRMVSFLRDLYVEIPGTGRARLNAAYFHGGEKLLKQTLESCFDVRVDHTVTIHFSMLAELVDQLGGIEIDVSEKELPALNGIITDYNSAFGRSGDRVHQAGLQRLNGVQALCYSRIRKIDSDFQRTSRQQEVIAAMLKKASSLGRWELLQLAVMNLPKVQTDMNLIDVMALLPLVMAFDELELESAHVPFEGAYTDETISGMMVLVPDLQRCRTQLHAFLEGGNDGNTSDH